MRVVSRLMAVAALLTMGTWALAQKSTSPQSDPPVDDQTFVTKVAADGKHEVMLGELAKNQAASADVKKFGERMITDHTKANEQLLAAAKAAKIAVPGGLPEEMAKEVQRFRGLKGAEFDKAYIKHMVEDHEKAVKLFENASKNLKDPGLRDFATKTLPTIKEHLELAKKLSGQR
jgi:putative membrane protein